MPDTAIILAGGFGTRLQKVVSSVPKPMAPVNGQPFLSYLLRYLKQNGIKHIILSTGYLADSITSYFKSEWEGLHIQYAEEKTPLGTGGAIRFAMELTSSPNVLVMNGDSFFDISIDKLRTVHSTQNAQVSMALRHVPDAARYGSIEVNAQNRITAFREKSGNSAPGIINGGVYIIDCQHYLAHTPESGAFSIEEHFFKTHLTTLYFTGLQFDGYFIDIGIPEDYQKAQDDFKRFAY
ncbi:MAG: nucleotidyltransferase family protein [Sediminibacterium sp.]|nr:nucleotidyltransferase family protein [Sediminibacterium sp.]